MSVQEQLSDVRGVRAIVDRVLLINLSGVLFTSSAAGLRPEPAHLIDGGTLVQAGA